MDISVGLRSMAARYLFLGGLSTPLDVEREGDPIVLVWRAEQGGDGKTAGFHLPSFTAAAGNTSGSGTLQTETQPAVAGSIQPRGRSWSKITAAYSKRSNCSQRRCGGGQPDPECLDVTEGPGQHCKGSPVDRDDCETWLLIVAPVIEDSRQDLGSTLEQRATNGTELVAVPSVVDAGSHRRPVRSWWPIIALTVAILAIGFRLRLKLWRFDVPRRVGSLAVLPFENLSNDPEQEFFA